MILVMNLKVKKVSSDDLKIDDLDKLINNEVDNS